MPTKLWLIRQQRSDHDWCRYGIVAILLGAAMLLTPLAGGEEPSKSWSQWRGPLGTGVAPDANPPVTWSETDHIRFKIAIPGKGHSTPIVHGDSIFLTAAIPYGDALEPRFSGRPGAHDNLPVTHQHKFVALAVNRKDGSIRWQNTLHQALPLEGGHNTASLASASPVTDGERVYVTFGSHGLYCLDREGQVLWKVNLGTMQTKHGHGEGSSPVLFGDILAVNWDHEGESYVAAFDKRTGRQLWKAARNEVTSWSTPIVVEHQGTAQLIVSGTSRVRGYNLATGEVIWECGGLSANIVASPVSANGMVFAGSSYEKRAFLAVRLAGAQGNITNTDHLVWSRSRGTPYVPSPLLYGNSLYFLRHYQGILSRVSVADGSDDGGPYRLGPIGNVYASPVGAADRIYVTDLNGKTLVIEHAIEPKVLSMNQLNDRFSASAAIVGNELFLRGERFLYCISRQPTPASSPQ